MGWRDREEEMVSGVAFIIVAWVIVLVIGAFALGGCTRLKTSKAANTGLLNTHCNVVAKNCSLLTVNGEAEVDIERVKRPKSDKLELNPEKLLKGVKP